MPEPVDLGAVEQDLEHDFVLSLAQGRALLRVVRAQREALGVLMYRVQLAHGYVPSRYQNPDEGRADVSEALKDAAAALALTLDPEPR